MAAIDISIYIAANYDCWVQSCGC